MSDVTRREFGLAALSALLMAREPAAGARVEREPFWTEGARAFRRAERAKPMRGAFMILTTPFTASGEVDWEDLAREAVFCDRCGAHGVVWPQGSSGVANLTKAERMRGLDVLATAARGKATALVLGVQGKDTAEMLEYAERAEALDPDAMIAMPPSAAHSLDEYREYFRALAKATSRPVIVQTSGGAR